jgi:hypothetical protein
MNSPENHKLESTGDLNRGEVSHLTDELLLLAADGELSASEANRVRLHLEACWSCRVRQEKVQEAITSIVEYRDLIVQPHLPPSRAGRAMFAAHLEQVAKEAGRPSWRNHFLGILRSAVAHEMPSRAAWVAAAVIAMVVSLFVGKLLTPTTVSAGELLRKAQASEIRSLRSVNQPVIYQKLRIRVGAHSVTRKIYRDTVGNRKASQIEAGEASVSAAQNTFRSSGFDWDNPLSAAAYDTWRNGLSNKHDEVRVLPQGLLELKTTSDGGPVREASLTVRSADYHPVEEGIVLQDSQRIEIAELNYQVFELENVSLALFATPPPLLLPTLKSSASVPLGPSETDLAESELEVRLALHSAQADLGEEIEIERAGQHEIVVTGLAQNAKRKEELLSALQGIPFAQSRLQTVDEAVAKQSPDKLSGRPLLVTVETTPLLDKELKARFPNSAERADFVDQTLSLAQVPAARSWALRRLADRYTPRELALLSHASRQKFEALLSDHVAALLLDVTKLQAQLDKILPPVITADSAVNSVQNPQDDDWRGSVRRTHSSIQTVNEEVAVLVAGSAPDSLDSKTLEQQLRASLAQLQRELQLLDQQIPKS